MFQGYYQLQGLFESEDEWDVFMESLRRPLPVTFRVNRGLHSEELVEHCLARAQHILEPADRDLPFERGARVARPQRLEWCDGVQLGVDRMVLKTGRSQYVKDLRRWLMLWGCGSAVSFGPTRTGCYHHTRDMGRFSSVHASGGCAIVRSGAV